MKAIIFGANGQDGFYLRQLLIEKGMDVIGIGRKADTHGTDITSYTEVSDLIRNEKPAYIFHLAANSTTKHEALFDNHAVIATGTLNILEAVKIFSPETKVFISGSGLQFRNENRPIREVDDFEASDAYSVSRIQSVYAGRYFRKLGLKVYVGYFFNHDSPRRTERHVAKKISAAVKRIGEGSEEKLEIGDASVVKEWGFAGDIVNGIWLLVSQDKIFEANISTGEGYSIAEWIKECFAVIGKDPSPYVIEKNNFIPEYKRLVSDASVIHSLGFKPLVTFKKLAYMMIHDK